MSETGNLGPIYLVVFDCSLFVGQIVHQKTNFSFYICYFLPVIVFSLWYFQHFNILDICFCLWCFLSPLHLPFVYSKIQFLSYQLFVFDIFCCPPSWPPLSASDWVCSTWFITQPMMVRHGCIFNTLMIIIVLIMRMTMVMITFWL